MEFVNLVIDNVMDFELLYKDEMESFWFVEIFKYYYFLFVELMVISLDEWVLNIEVYFFRRLI